LHRDHRDGHCGPSHPASSKSGDHCSGDHCSGDRCSGDRCSGDTVPGRRGLVALFKRGANGGLAPAGVVTRAHVEMSSSAGLSSAGLS
jgi:hypothetical protein